MQERGKEAKNNSESQNKSKGNGKGKGKGKAGNHVGDGSPVRRHPTDPWDDLRNAWAVEISQSKNGGPSQGTHPNQNQNQQQKQQKQHQNHHPNGQQSGSASVQNRRGRGGGGGGGGHVHAGQKRKATESVTNGITGTDDGGGDRGQAPKRQKSEKRPRQPPSNADSSGTAARSHPDFWHPDGSVVIQVEKTKFRLHQSTLERKSAYFAAVFGKKGSSHKRGGRAYIEVEVDERSPNGHHLPVYRVAETTADDFATLLTVIEESTCVLCIIGVFLSFFPAPLPSGETAIAYCTFFFGCV